ncbi:hypothetical protein F0562_014119 [Nyssa sinensis]|uniref:Legume lectin domain-containing protein n=1 Tax=Nyssa sinensis TaxID=561372 RepID=A0A5J4ZRT6_9ASTE|nr:hypothetical protein F0562_014119 [Nyssa sinensis]
MKKHPQPPLLPSLLPIILSFQSIFAIDFVFNGFDPANTSLYGVATIQSRILTLTNDTTFTIGRALYPSKIRTKEPNSSLVLPFSTSFIFSIAPYRDSLPGHGMVFLFVPFKGIKGASEGQHLGFVNRTNDGKSTNHLFGIEFDVFQNEEFGDINANHVGINLNSLTSEEAQAAGYWPDNQRNNDEKSFKELKLNSGKNYQVWIDYADFHINVTMAPVGMKRPRKPLLNVPINLSWVLEEEIFSVCDVGTRRFSDENVIGIGGNGKVYKGVLVGVEVAMKRIVSGKQ